MPMQVQKDRDGKVITNPVTSWALMPVADIAVLLAIQYSETPQELETGDTRQIQFLLRPQACLELAEKLTTLAKRVLEDEPPLGKPPN